MTARRPATVLAGVLALLAVLHGYWALGGRWGPSGALGGQTARIPPAWSIWLVAVLLIGAALNPLGRAGIWGRRWPGWIFTAGCWGLSAVLALVGVLNAAGQTKLERLGFAPFALILAGVAAEVARWSRRPSA